LKQTVPIIVDKEKKRKEIIEAAIAVFSRTGYHRATIKEIADEAGVGKGTVYEYFESKEDLFLHMSEYLYELYMLSQRAALESIDDPEEQIRSLIASTLANAAMWTGLTYLFIDMWSELDRIGREDKLRKLMSTMLDNFVGAISKGINDGKQKGRFKGVDETLVSHIIVAVLDGLVFQLLVDAEAFDLQAMADTLVGVLLDGLKKQRTN
jgi:TetR/AcrR family fatty acid metabolism transcriptional regulator